jgi:glycogen synthase
MKQKSSPEFHHPDAFDFSSVETARVLESWTRPEVRNAALKALFGKRHADRIDAAGISPGERIVFYLLYETPEAKSGGVEAVGRILPAELADAGEKIIRVSPLHSNLVTSPDLKGAKPNAVCLVSYAGFQIEVSIYCLKIKGHDWILFGAAGFFEADGGDESRDPYVYSRETKMDRDGEQSMLLRDALFACQAIPRVLQALGHTSDLVLHAQDWQFASVALTAREALLDGTLASARVLLTMHNPFDHGCSETNLARISTRCHPYHWPAIPNKKAGEEEPRSTVLSRMIPLLDAPVSTVSRNFALELTRDPLQTGHFTAHYQNMLSKQGLVGIDNGLFEPARALDQATREATDERKYDFFLKRKLSARKKMLGLLPEFQANNRHRIFGELDVSNLADDIPIFMMVGRLDPGQKGFDLFAHAIEQLPPGMGRYIVSPLSPMAEDREIAPFLDYLKDVANRRKGEVIVCPFMLIGVYDEFKAGVTWSNWSSIYEPFGGLSEFYVNFTPVIGRATGGIAQQVIDLDAAPEESTGLMWNVLDADGQTWRELEEASIGKRLGDPLFRALSDELAACLLRAAVLYREQPEDYGRMLSNLPAMQERLSWDRSVKDYRAWYDAACQ